MATKPGCYVGLHQWQTHQAEGGVLYKVCRDCGKFVSVSGRRRLRLKQARPGPQGVYRR
jgi:hypothetical protein